VRNLAVERNIFEPEHLAFRETVRQFLARHVLPHHASWERAGMVERWVWKVAAEQGLLGLQAEEAYGGGGVDDFRFNVILDEEIARSGATGLTFGLQNDIVGPYLYILATREQKRRWLPGVCRGETILAIAMSEPEAGSDLQGIKTTAVRDGDHYVLNGTKTFISSGMLADLVVVVARTDREAGARGFSLLVVERDMDGFERGRNLDKVGLKAMDTAELFFRDVRVPVTNLLGTEGGGFGYLMANLPQERLNIAVSAVAAAEAAQETTLQYSKRRTAFGQPIGRFQHSKFTLAEMATEVQIARVFVDRCVELHVRGELTAVEAAMAKWWTTELHKKVVDACVQLHGGYGYMLEYPIARAYLDTRVETIFGGTTEIMKEIIGRSLGL
jgi:alkylation response protein AidB-like acyl-CoA dehydrogenase